MGFFDRIFGSGEPDPEREPTSPLTFEEWARLKGYPEGMEPPVADGHGNLSFGMAAKVAVKAERHADNAMKRTGLPDQTSGAILSHKQLHDLWHKMPDSSFKVVAYSGLLLCRNAHTRLPICSMTSGVKSTH
eukprot:SAG31_NODE_5987_length_2224_cov_2.069647_3_plen_132_part_00